MNLKVTRWDKVIIYKDISEFKGYLTSHSFRLSSGFRATIYMDGHTSLEVYEDGI